MRRMHQMPRGAGFFAAIVAADFIGFLQDA
jgi:hypothetical protein